MVLSQMPGALSWAGTPDAFDRVYATYVDLLIGVLERRAVDDGCAEEVARFYDWCQRLDAGGFMRFLTAPETSRRLLFRGVSPTERWRFFVASLQAEAARAGQPVRFTEETWTPLGDAAFLPDGQQISWPQIGDMMPLDFGSPYARSVDLSGERLSADGREQFTREELETGYHKVRQALLTVGTVSPVISEFMVRFNMVLILQKDPSQPDQCDSGSNGQYIGRSFITNVHSPKVTPEAIADAAVHEGIHALLYMQQVQQPWGPDDVIYDQTPRVPSPWTGRWLPLRSFMEACFVWYGLVHFWADALGKPELDLRQAQTFMARAMKGFLKPVTLTDLPGEYRPVLLDDVLQTIAEMQGRIRTAWAQ